jgi:hypothetical protein
MSEAKLKPCPFCGKEALIAVLFIVREIAHALPRKRRQNSTLAGYGARVRNIKP